MQTISTLLVGTFLTLSQCKTLPESGFSSIVDHKLASDPLDTLAPAPSILPGPLIPHEGL